METYKRICIKNYKIEENRSSFELQRGKEYLTSKEKEETVTVFTTFWIKLVPVSIFAGEIEFT
jgi:hypothetical protein